MAKHRGVLRGCRALWVAARDSGLSGHFAEGTDEGIRPKVVQDDALCMARQGWGDQELSVVAAGCPGMRGSQEGGVGTKGPRWPGDPSPPSVAAAAPPPTWAAVVPAAVKLSAPPQS